MTVTLNLNPDIEQGLRAQARERGVSLSDYLQEIVSKQVHSTPPGTAATGKTLKLPHLHLGAMSSLHRRDIYDDAS